MVVSSFPFFEWSVGSLWTRNRADIEAVRATLIQAEGQGDGHYSPTSPDDTKHFFLIELEHIINSGECKHFEIEDDVKEMLLRTRAPKKPDLHLPFEYLFLDCKMRKDELLRMNIHLDTDEIRGIMVRFGDILYWSKEEKPEVVGKDLRLSVCSIDEGNDEHFVSVTTFSSNIEIWLDRGKVDLDAPSAISLNDQKIVRDFVVNFLYFLNNPEVKYVYHERSEKNIQRRIREHKPILPSSYSITITGQTLRYLDEVRAGLRMECQYAFDVRGHYRQLQSPFYKQKRGVRIWVSHFVKGKDKGFIVEKYYDLDNKNQNNGGKKE